MKNLIIFVTVEIAELADFYFSEHSEKKIVAFCADDAYVKDPKFCGRPVVPLSELAKKFSPKEHEAFVAVSYARMNRLRAEKYQALKKAGYKMATYVSP